MYIFALINVTKMSKDKTSLKTQNQPSCLGGVMPRISHFVSEIGQKYPANDEAVLIEIQDGYLRFYEIGYDFERIYLTPVYVA
jgi:hypothetical protein